MVFKGGREDNGYLGIPTVAQPLTSIFFTNPNAEGVTPR